MHNGKSRTGCSWSRQVWPLRRYQKTWSWWSWRPSSVAPRFRCWNAPSWKSARAGMTSGRSCSLPSSLPIMNASWGRACSIYVKESRSKSTQETSSTWWHKSVACRRTTRWLASCKGYAQGQEWSSSWRRSDHWPRPSQWRHQSSWQEAKAAHLGHTQRNETNTKVSHILNYGATARVRRDNKWIVSSAISQGTTQISAMQVKQLRQTRLQVLKKMFKKEIVRIFCVGDVVNVVTRLRTAAAVEKLNPTMSR